MCCTRINENLRLKCDLPELCGLLSFMPKNIAIFFSVAELRFKGWLQNFENCFHPPKR